MTANIIAAVMAVNLEFIKRCGRHNYHQVYFNDLSESMEMLVSGGKDIEVMIVILTPVGNLEEIMKTGGLLMFTVYVWTGSCIQTQNVIHI